jgi:hypothetical protein
MHHIQLVAPGDGTRRFVKASVAAEFLGPCHEDTMDKVLLAFPWVAVKKVGKEKMYSVSDLAVVSYLMERMRDEDAKS